MINMDFSTRVAINTSAMAWTKSPAMGVWRKPLERAAAESGHTTSIVKYDPGSRFAQHHHPLGEEILVLQGVFSDESGDYPAGTYLRNPPGSRHSPFSDLGCTIFVKLNQFMAQDLEPVRVKTHEGHWQDRVDGLKVMPLHEFNGERVVLLNLRKGQCLPANRHLVGEEILVVSGELQDERGTYPALSWLRRP